MTQPAVISLADLPPSEGDHPGDPGCDWHPRPDKEGVRDADGLLVDLDEYDVEYVHADKPEAGEHYDGVVTRARVNRDVGWAEASDHSPEGVV